MTHSRTRRLAAWIAMFAMALAALAPTVSRALAWGAASPGAWIKVCTASGMQQVALPGNAADGGGDAGKTRPTHLSLDHCPFCFLTADRLGPPAQPTPQFRVDGASPPPPVGVSTVTLRSPVLAARPRGPPLPASCLVA